MGEEWFKELNDIYYGREKQAYALLDALGCKYRKRQAGLFVWAELPEGYEGDSFAFSDEVMDKCDVFLTPGGIFGSEGNGYIRITLCCPEELLKKATDKSSPSSGNNSRQYGKGAPRGHRFPRGVFFSSLSGEEGAVPGVKRDPAAGRSCNRRL